MMTRNAAGTVSALWRYPVKSMQGEELNRVEIGTRGVAGDRTWALIDRETSKVASAKNPRKWRGLFDFSATYLEQPHVDTASAVQIVLPDELTVRSFDKDCDQQLSQALGRSVALAATPPPDPSLEEYWPDIDGLTHRDVVTEETMPSGTFFDLAVIHLLTTATIDRLRELYPQGRFEVRRFRPNIVVTPADGEAGFVENGWIGRRLMLGDDVQLLVTGACPRCVMTTLPQSDLPRDPGVLRTAAQHNDANVGVYATVIQGGTVHRGAALRLE